METNSKNTRKPTKKESKMSINEIREIVKLMKEEKVISFNYNGLAVNFSPYALMDAPKPKPQVESKMTDDKLPSDQDDDEYLFDAVVD